MKADRNKLTITLALGLMIGLLGIAINHLPGTATWEEQVGLDLLFKLRGQRPPPQDVAIVAINGKTSPQLGLGEEIPEWPRSLHAQLIERLDTAGARVIAYDIYFKKARKPDTDAEMARAMREAAKVVLVAYLQQQQLSDGGQNHQLEQLIPPAPLFADAALATAPFVLPKIPVRVSRFWTFSGAQQHISLPALALQLALDPQAERLQKLLIQANPQGADPLSLSHDPLRLAQQLRSQPGLVRLLDEILQQQVRLAPDPGQYEELLALTALYQGTTHPYLNFYGPPGTIPTHPIQNLLGSTDVDWSGFRDKTVFVGYSGHYQPRQKDGFYTVFSQPNGLDLSGVEIAATAYANLRHRETLKHNPGLATMVILGFGLSIVLILRTLPGLSGIAAGVLFSGTCFVGVYILFYLQHRWLPWFVPLAVQMPVAMITTQLTHYRQIRKSRERLRQLFGYYLPGDVIDRLVKDNRQPHNQVESAFGVCLATDAANYTALAENMSPEALQQYLNRYFELLFTPIRYREGVVSDVIGDAMLAIWPANETDSTLPQQACLAALEIDELIRLSDLEPKLVTRMGLHCGDLVMSHVGAIDHFEYRAVGDIVNTSSRIENLNKQLGTRILASDDFVRHLRGVVTRELGQFMVAGKQQPLTLHEIAATETHADPQTLVMHEAFAQALTDWKQGDRERANQQFEKILEAFPDDGPSHYYLQQFRERRNARRTVL
ncbi:MAG: adenylate/guanylate cyclase domain-containing protein [Candidatus Thiodiazotropha sp.]